MSNHKDKYNEILRKQNTGELLIYIDSAAFRKFFVEVDNDKAKNLIGNSLKKESTIIKIIMYGLEPLTLLVTIVSAIFLLKWIALLIVPVLVLLWVFLKGQASIGKQSIVFPSILLLISIFVAFCFLDCSLWLKLFIVGIFAAYYSSKLLYYLSARFAFNLIHKNYRFFKLFYKEPEGAAIPMIWTEPVN